MERPRPPPPLPTANHPSPILASPPRFQDKSISVAARETSAPQRGRQSKRLSERPAGNAGNLNPPYQNERQQTSPANVIRETLYYLFLPKSLKRLQASWPALGDPTQSTRGCPGRSSAAKQPSRKACTLNENTLEMKNWV